MRAVCRALTLAALMVPAIEARAQPAAPAPAQAASASLFDQAFSQRRNRAPQKMALPVNLDGRELGTLDAQVSGSTVRLARAPLAQALQAVLRPELHAQLASTQEGPWVGTDDLARLGLKAIYSAERIAVDLEVPLAQRARRRLRLGSQALPEGERTADEVLHPEPMSAVLNLRWIESRDGSARRARLYTEGAARWHEWVLEGQGSLPLDGSGGGFTRGDTRLVRDWPGAAVRLVAGDVATRAIGMLGTQALGGVRVSRQFALDPALGTQSLPAQGVGLPAGGSVDVVVNGFVVRTLRLGPGVYDLRDIPVFNGANDVVVRIVEPGGRVTEQRLAYFFDAGLLAPGLQDWDVSLGQPLQAGTGPRGYASGMPVVSAWWRRGWTATLTGGLGLQWQRRPNGDALVLQQEGAWASPLGTWGGWLAQSRHSFGQGQAAAVQWRWSTRARPDATLGASLVAQAQRRDARFAAVEATRPGGAATDLGLRGGLVWGGGWGATLGWAKRAQAGQPTAGQISATMRRRLDRHWGIEFGATRDRVTGTLVFAQLRYSGEADPAGGAVQGALAWQSEQQRWQADWQATGVGTLAGGDAPWRVAASRADARDATESRVAGEVRTGRGEWTWSTTLLTSSLGGSTLNEFSYAGSLVVTREGLRVGAPVNDSAALLVARPGLQGLKLLVDPQRSAAAATSDWFGAPVLPDLVAYTPREIQLDVENLPPGRSLGVDRPLLMPAYRSVILVPVGSDANSQLTGRVTLADGQPVALAALQIWPMEGERTPVDVFTTRKGGFTTPPLRPGRYQLRKPGEATALAQYVIAPDHAGMMDVGTVVLKEDSP